MADKLIYIWNNPHQTVNIVYLWKLGFKKMGRGGKNIYFFLYILHYLAYNEYVWYQSLQQL